MEIERRFLIRDIDKVNELVAQNASTRKAICQDYIYVDMFTAIRKRKAEKGGNTKYTYTIKTGGNGMSVNEIEREISEEEYNKLQKVEGTITIDKERYCIPYIDDLIIELDVFHGDYEGIIFAEIEFTSEEQGTTTEMPDWFGPELTGKVNNGRMTREIVDFSKF